MRFRPGERVHLWLVGAPGVTQVRVTVARAVELAAVLGAQWVSASHIQGPLEAATGGLLSKTAGNGSADSRGEDVDRRVVITGIDVIAPGGVGSKEFWNLLISGRTATRQISFFDPSPFRSRIAGECDFDPAARGLRPREIRRMDRAAQFAVTCARESVVDSGLEMSIVDPSRAGVSLGSAVGAATSIEREYLVLSDSGREWLVDGDISRHTCTTTWCPARPLPRWHGKPAPKGRSRWSRPAVRPVWTRSGAHTS